MRILVLLLLVCISVLWGRAEAHTRSQSFSNWSIEENTLAYDFVVDARRVTQLAPLYENQQDLSAILEAHLKETVRVYQSGEPCPLVWSITQGARAYRGLGRFECATSPDQAETSLSIGAFYVVSPTHIHIAKIEMDGDTIEYALREGDEAVIIGADSAEEVRFGFVGLGFFHVLSGLDHILFIIALALVANRPRLILFVVTGFTIGHTITLGLTAYGLIDPNEKIIEALIGFTIAIAALEAGGRYGLNRRRALAIFAGLAFFAVLVSAASWWLGVLLAVFAFSMAQQSEKSMAALLPAVTAIFGAIHGAGFAGGLAKAQIEKSETFWPLLGFNIGVELGQVAILGAAYLAGFALNKLLPAARNVYPGLVSLGIFTLGGYWFFVRLWG